MDYLRILTEKQRFHFIGVGGISMSALAKYLVLLGKSVTGSDVCYSDAVKELKLLGVKVYDTHSADNVENAEVVVYTSAINETNPEYLYAVERGLPLVKRSELLGVISGSYKMSIGVAGSHGKTTATAMLSRVLVKAKLNPTCFIGGNDNALGNFKMGNGSYCVYEACEYKSNFLDLKPYLSVVLNVDIDHLESYGSEEKIISAFGKFVSSRQSLINLDDERAKDIITPTSVTFGVTSKADYVARNLVKNDGRYSFTVFSKRKLGRINLKIKGKHNVYNALAVTAVADMLGVRFCHIKSALEEFDGVGRRMEKLGCVYGGIAYADYAHHPKELIETLKVFNNPVVVFQPHTYSRTELLMYDFVRALKDCGEVIIYKTYPAREKYSEQGTAQKLYENLKALKSVKTLSYADNVNELKNALKCVMGEGKTVVFFGAGDIYQIAKELTD